MATKREATQYRQSTQLRASGKAGYQSRMPKIATLSDIESNGPTITTDGNGNLLCRTGNTTWSLNVLLWAGLMVAANILHPPAIIMFLLNGVLLMLNLNAVRVAGQRDTPMWLWVIIVLQVLITLQYGSYLLRGGWF